MFLLSILRYSTAGDIRDFAAAQKQQLLEKEIHITERSQLDVDNRIITENNEQLHAIKEVCTCTF
jgi:hypothetical protein